MKTWETTPTHAHTLNVFVADSTSQIGSYFWRKKKKVERLLPSFLPRHIPARREDLLEERAGSLTHVLRPGSEARDRRRRERGGAGGGGGRAGGEEEEDEVGGGGRVCVTAVNWSGLQLPRILEKRSYSPLCCL